MVTTCNVEILHRAQMGQDVYIRNTHVPYKHIYKLGECRTLLGERKQAIHSFNIYQRLFSEVSDHSTQVAWHVAEQSLSLYSLQKCLTA